MDDARSLRAVRIELELRVTYQDEPGRFARLLTILREAGGRLNCHLAYRLSDDRCVALFVCEKPADAALRIREVGFEVGTETVLVVRTEGRHGALGHLVSCIEAAGIGIAYSYAMAHADEFVAVISTDDNPRAEDVLAGYLFPEEPEGATFPPPKK